jgi:hypothetical protein
VSCRSHDPIRRIKLIPRRTALAKGLRAEKLCEPRAATTRGGSFSTSTCRWSSSASKLGHEALDILRGLTASPLVWAVELRLLQSAL